MNNAEKLKNIITTYSGTEDFRVSTMNNTLIIKNSNGFFSTQIFTILLLLALLMGIEFYILPMAVATPEEIKTLKLLFRLIFGGIPVLLLVLQLIRINRVIIDFNQKKIINKGVLINKDEGFVSIKKYSVQKARAKGTIISRIELVGKKSFFIIYLKNSRTGEMVNTITNPITKTCNAQILGKVILESIKSE